MYSIHTVFHRLPSLIAASLLALGLALSAPAWALSLGDAKAQGLVGETPSGYLSSPASKVSSEVQSLITSINNKRKAAYKDSAKKAGVELNIFEKRIGQRLVNEAPAGQIVQLPDGSWVKK